MTVSSAFTISRRTESFCFSSRRICIGTREWLQPLKSLRSARPHDRSRIEMSMKQRAGLPQIYTAWARCDEVCGIKWTLPIFRPTATSFSPTTASPGSRSSVNDSILHQAADDAEGELEVDAQGLADLGHERGWLAPQILHDGPSGFGFRPVSDDDYFGLPKVLDVGFDCPFQELGPRLHVCSADQIINLREKLGRKAERDRRFSHRPVLHVLHALHLTYLTSSATMWLQGSKGVEPKGPCAGLTIRIRWIRNGAKDHRRGRLLADELCEGSGECGGERGGDSAEPEVGARVRARDGTGWEEGEVVPRDGADILRRGAMKLTRGGRGGAGRSRTGPRSFPRALRRVERGSLSTPRPRRQSRSCPRGIRTDSHRRSDRGPLSESRSFATG